MKFTEEEIVIKALSVPADRIQKADEVGLSEFLKSHDIQDLLDERTLNEFWDEFTILLPGKELYYNEKNEGELIAGTASAFLLFQKLFVNGVENDNLIEMAPLVFITKRYDLPLSAFLPGCFQIDNIKYSLKSVWNLLETFTLKIKEFGLGPEYIKDAELFVFEKWEKDEFNSLPNIIEGIYNQCLMQSCCSLVNFYRLALIIDVNKVVDILNEDSLTTKICKMSFFDENELTTLILNEGFQDPFLLFTAIHFISSARRYKSERTDVSIDNVPTDEFKADQVLELAFTKIGTQKIDLFSYYDPINFTDHSKHAYSWGCALAKINDEQRNIYVDTLDFSEKIFWKDWKFTARTTALTALSENISERKVTAYCIRVARQWDKWVNEYLRNPEAHAVQSLMTGYWVDVVEGYKSLYSKFDDAENAILELLNCHEDEIHTWFPSSVTYRLIYTKLTTYLTTFAEVIVANKWELDAASELGSRLLSVFQDQRLWLMLRDMPIEEDETLRLPSQLDRIKRALFGEELMNDN